MINRNEIAKSAAFNWVALFVSVAVSFFLSPFVVHRLGSNAYGVWIFLNSTIAFMSFLDLGLRGTVTRFVAREYTRGDHAAVSSTVSAIFWFRTLLGICALLVGMSVSGVIASSLDMPAGLYSDARWALVILAGSVASTFSTGVFGGVLAALQRFDLLGSVTISQTLVRALAVIWLLNSGYGILALAILDFCIVLTAGLALRCLVWRKYRQLRIVFRLPDRSNLREIFSYSVYVYIINVCLQVVYYTDNIVVGVFLSSAAVTTFAIGGGLVEYLRQVVSALTVTFTPLASSIGAAGRDDQLRKLLIYGTRAALLIALPIAAALFTRGHTFIGLWMGAEYADTSSRVMSILLLAAIAGTANTTSGGICLGLGKHRIAAFFAIGDAICNFALSVLLVGRLGIVGVAWGTAIPSLIVNLLMWPLYACRMLEVRIAYYLWQSWIRPCIAVIPFAIACYVVDHVWIASNMSYLFLQMATLLPLFALGAAVTFSRESAELLQSRHLRQRYLDAVSAMKRAIKLS